MGAVAAAAMLCNSQKIRLYAGGGRMSVSKPALEFSFRALFAGVLFGALDSGEQFFDQVSRVHTRLSWYWTSAAVTAVVHLPCLLQISRETNFVSTDRISLPSVHFVPLGLPAGSPEGTQTFSAA